MTKPALCLTEQTSEEAVKVRATDTGLKKIVRKRERGGGGGREMGRE